MAEDESGNAGDKPFAPTQRKLDDARSKGNVARSNDLNAAVAYAGLVLAAVIWGGAMLSGFGMALTGFFSDRLWQAVDLRSGSTVALTTGPILEAFLALSPVFLFPLVLVLAGILAQRTMIFYGGNLSPKLSRLSPIENAKKKFGRSGLFEFFKSFLKLSLYSLLLAFYIYKREPQMIASAMLDAHQVILLLGELSVGFFLVVLAIAACLGIIDYAFQKAEHLRNLRMSHKEMMDEHKNSEGDPTMKQRRRQRAQELSQVQMLQKVKDADVVIVNPEHYAVALAWTRAPGSAPECVAKGVDELALTIRRLAAENAVPIYPEPPTARALFATVDIGQEIAPEHYGPVAAAIRFAEGLREKRRNARFGSI